MLIIGHRGASAAYPENTLDAFAGAAGLGAHGIETDLRRTADGQVAICHDPTLPDGRLVVELRRDELPAWIPTLEQTLDSCAWAEFLNLEVKNWPEDPDFDEVELLADLVVGSLADRPELRARTIISSFHLATIDRVRALDDRIATGWLTAGMTDPVALAERTAERGHRAFHPHESFVDAPLVERAHDLGLQLNTWTVDDPERIRELGELGVDAVITNVPDVAIAALGDDFLGGVTLRDGGSVGE